MWVKISYLIAFICPTVQDNKIKIKWRDSWLAASCKMYSLTFNTVLILTVLMDDWRKWAVILISSENNFLPFSAVSQTPSYTLRPTPPTTVWRTSWTTAAALLDSSAFGNSDPKYTGAAWTRSSRSATQSSWPTARTASNHANWWAGGRTQSSPTPTRRQRRQTSPPSWTRCLWTSSKDGGAVLSPLSHTWGCLVRQEVLIVSLGRKKVEPRCQAAVRGETSLCSLWGPAPPASPPPPTPLNWPTPPSTSGSGDRGSTLPRRARSPTPPPSLLNNSPQVPLWPPVDIQERGPVRKAPHPESLSPGGLWKAAGASTQTCGSEKEGGCRWHNRTTRRRKSPGWVWFMHTTSDMTAFRVMVVDVQN